MPARRPLLSLALLLALASLLMAAPSASAAIKAKPSLTSTAAGTRIVVKLSSTRRLARRARPTAVSVRAGATRYKLRRVRAAGAAVSLGTWRSSAYKGAAATRLLAQEGKRVTVTVRSRAGKTSLKPKLPAAPTRRDGGSGPPFEAPGRELSGQEAYDHIKRYFVNSRFTDCPAGWPNCAVEERYSHCANGSSWEYHRYTPSSGSDINSYGSLQVSGAVVHANGSWAIEYVVSAYGNQSFYHWELAQDRSARGAYWAPGVDPRVSPASEQLGPMTWQQPATFPEPANCG